MNQAHNKFKVFIGAPAQDGSPGDLATQIERFVTEHAVAPKSIGAEYLERSRRVIITLGYRDDQGAVPVRIHAVRIGSFGGEPDLAAIEAAMGAAASAEESVICHELYVTEKDDLFMIFMSQRS